MSGAGGTDDALARAADQLAEVAQGQADVEEPTGHDGRPAGSDVHGAAHGPDGGGTDGGGTDGHVPVAPDDVAPAPDVEEAAASHDARP